MKPIPQLDLVAQFAQIGDEVMREIERVCRTQRFILGPDVDSLEHDLAEYCGAGHAVGCGSGSDAILLALRALDIGPGDAVLTVPYTFFATAGYIAHSGARPVFVDIEPDTFNLDVTQVEAALDRHPEVKAIMPVHLFGACADMGPILDIATHRGIAVVEDAAQSIGAEYEGRRAGSMGHIGCFSFYPGKNLGAYGEAGLVTTNDERLATRMKALRVHGGLATYYHDEIGYNSRLDALQAAVLRVKLRYLDEWTAARQANAARYTELFTHSGAPVVPPRPAAYANRHVFNQYVIRVPERDAVKKSLADQGIGTSVYYPLPLHLQKCFAYLGYREGDFPVSEQMAHETLALPVYPELPPQDLERVVEAVKTAVLAAAR
jgi:dTDP-4-amino-4,6-dideoxygalactose transaminase